MQTDLKQLIQLCIRGDRASQNVMYKLIAPKMFVICLRYSKTREEAEETLQEGFLKTFENLHQYKFEGVFEGWVGKIMVNCALQKFRSKPHLHAVIPIENMTDSRYHEDNINDNLDAKDLIKKIQQLPAGYRMVFNLYVFEGYKHREIAELLNISEGTSKSNLSDARNILKKSITNSNKSVKQNII